MVETWTSRGAFEKSPEFKTMISGMPQDDFASLVKQKEANVEKQITTLMKNISDTIPENQWKNPDYNSQAWPKISVAKAWEDQSLGLNGLDGIVCGHIHRPELATVEEVLYCNDGDWVESCTALVEHFDGRLEILEWAKLRSWSMIERARRVGGAVVEGTEEPQLA